MEPWLAFILAATILYGFFDFVNKVAAHNRYSSTLIVAIAAATISLVSLVFIAARGMVDEYLSWYEDVQADYLNARERLTRKLREMMNEEMKESK